MAIMYFKNGFLPEESCRVSIRDRSFRFGDGLFETMLAGNGRIFDFARHMERLRRGMEALRLHLPEMERMEEICLETLRHNPFTFGVLRVIVSRGEDEEGTSGYLPRGSAPYCMVHAHAKPYPSFHPLSLWHCIAPRLHTASKTNNALPYVLAGMEARENGCDNALLLDEEGHVCETGSGNIFWMNAGILHTPASTLPLIRGTMRERAISLWDGEIKEGVFTLEALREADEVFVTNTGGIVLPVTNLRPCGFVYESGSHAADLRHLLDKAILTELG